MAANVNTEQQLQDVQLLFSVDVCCHLIGLGSNY